MNNQEAFNIIWERAKDPRRAINGGQCRYRMKHKDGDTIACFVGALIPDKLYSTSIECLGVFAFTIDSNAFPERNIGRFLKGVDLSFLSECQRVHDTRVPSKWAPGLRAIAKRYGLEIPK